jgi:hypothetical protein
MMNGYALNTQYGGDTEIAEVLIYDHALNRPDDSARQSIESYLKQKWGLP